MVLLVVFHRTAQRLRAGHEQISPASASRSCAQRQQPCRVAIRVSARRGHRPERAWAAERDQRCPRAGAGDHSGRVSDGFLRNSGERQVCMPRRDGPSLTSPVLNISATCALIQLVPRLMMKLALHITAAPGSPSSELPLFLSSHVLPMLSLAGDGMHQLCGDGELSCLNHLITRVCDYSYESCLDACSAVLDNTENKSIVRASLGIIAEVTPSLRATLRIYFDALYMYCIMITSTLCGSIRWLLSLARCDC